MSLIWVDLEKIWKPYNGAYFDLGVHVVHECKHHDVVENSSVKKKQFKAEITNISNRPMEICYATSSLAPVYIQHNHEGELISPGVKTEIVVSCQTTHVFFFNFLCQNVFFFQSFWRFEFFPKFGHFSNNF